MADFKEVARLWEELTTHQAQYDPRVIKLYLEKPADSYSYIKDRIKKKALLVARADNLLVGYLTFEEGMFPKKRELKSIFIKDLYVKKEFRRQSIGRLLVEECLKMSKANNYYAVKLSVFPENEEAAKFYFDLGFGVGMLTLEKKLY